MLSSAETLQTQSLEQTVAERQRSFDPQASINMFRSDIQQFGQIQPETWNQVHNEELSYLVEGVDKPACTTFPLRRQGGNLVYFKGGEWRPYAEMLETGLRVAKEEAIKDPRRAFLAEAANTDKVRGLAMNQLQPGEKTSWTSPYWHDVAELYGDEFMDSCGLNSERRLGFICQATGTDEGIILESQTVDLSDHDAFAAVNTMIATNPQAELEELLTVHDDLLQEKFGEPHFAGRTKPQVQENAWETMLQQKDLTAYLLQGLETIAHQNLYGTQLERATKRHVYGVWAAFKERLDGNHVSSPSETHSLSYDKTTTVSFRPSIAIEVQRAFNKFVSEGRVLVGCGGSISVLQGEDDVFGASGKEVHSAIFGGKACKEVKNGEVTTCPSCKNKVKAIVPDRSTIYCSKDFCKLAAPGLRRMVKVSGNNTP